MDEKQKEKLREIVEEQVSWNYEVMITAKKNIDEVAKSVKKLFAITPGHFKKLVKLCYEDSIEAERRKFAELDELYIDLFEPLKKREDVSGLDPEFENEISASSEELERHEKIVERFNDELLKDESIEIKGAIK